MITRKELVSKYKIALKKIEELKAIKYDYLTNNTCASFGIVKNMDFGNILKAGATIHDGDTNLNERMKQYGILASDIDTKGTFEFDGYTVADWDHDFALRVTELHNEAKLAKYEEAAEKMLEHFSEDDKFRIAMGEIDELELELDDDDTVAEETTDNINDVVDETL